MRVLRISHSGVVDAWRSREREIRSLGVDLLLVSASVWDEGGSPVRLVPRAGEAVQGIRTLGSHPALFVYDPRALWRLLGDPWDVLDIHEEPFALATAEILALRALRRQRAPYVVYSAQNLDKRLPAPFRALERAVLRGARAVSVCNTAAGEILQHRGFAGVPDVIPLGVDVPASPPARSAAGRVVGYAGRLADHKGVAVLLDAVAALPDVRLLVAGAGPARDRLTARASRADLAGRVDVLGPLAGPDLDDFYRRVDVLAVPSLTTASWVEQFGRVAVEAMAAGTPVVASDSGALPDVVGGAGLLVPPGDAPALATALSRVLDDRGLADDLRRQGYARAESCDWKAVAAGYLRLYERVARRTVEIAAPRSGARDAGEARDVEVVVVAYGSAEQLGQALAPLDGRPCTVVDNSSSDAVRRVCATRSVRYLDAGANRGFAAGVNIALGDRLRPDADVLLLNPDAVIGPADVAELQRALAADRGLASVGPVQVDPAGRTARVGWPFPTPARAWAEALGLGRLSRTPDEFVIGSVLLLRAEALTQVGGLDERFFLYAEETDWAYRASRLGWRHAVVEGATAVHVGAGTSSDPDRREAHFHGSQEHYARKHYGAGGWQAVRAAQIMGAAGRAAILSGDRRSAAVKRLKAYLAGPAWVERRYRDETSHPGAAVTSG